MTSTTEPKSKHATITRLISITRISHTAANSKIKTRLKDLDYSMSDARASCDPEVIRKIGADIYRLGKKISRKNFQHWRLVRIRLLIQIFDNARTFSENLVYAKPPRKNARNKQQRITKQ